MGMYCYYVIITFCYKVRKIVKLVIVQYLIGQVNTKCIILWMDECDCVRK